MKIIFLLLLIIITLCPFFSSSQNNNLNNVKWEIVYGGGLSNYKGDIGKTNKNIINIFSRTAGDVCLRWKYNETLALKFNIIYGKVSGEGTFLENATNITKKANFKTTIFEQSFQIEYSLLKEKYGIIYTFSNMKRFSFKNINTYLFMGIGGFQFSPHIKLEDENWKKTNNEINTNKAYYLYQIVFPIGIGFKYGLNRDLSIGLEFSYRYTTTDYIDSYSEINNKNKDRYTLMMINFNYKLKTTKRGFPNLNFLIK